MTNIPGNNTTNETIDLNGSVFSSIDFEGDRDWFSFSIDSSQFVEVSLEGIGIGGIEDTVLTIYDEMGNEIAFNDDVAFPVDFSSGLSFFAVAGQTYYIEAAGYQDDTFADTGDYILITALGTAPVLIDSLIWGTQWDDPVITYYFAPNGVSNPDADGFTSDGFTSYEREQFLTAFAAIAAVANLTFTEAATAADADLVLIVDDNEVINLPPDDQFLGFFNTPDGGTQNSGVFNANGTGWDRTPGGGLEEGGYGYVTIVHELLHGLGMSHPHDNGGTSDVMQGVTQAFDDYGLFNLNQGIFTTMSYNTGFLTGNNSVPDGFDYGYEAGPMALDIAVLQALYGANEGTFAGDDTHILVNTNGTGTAWRTIWDADGNDTIQHIGSADAVIDLRAATLEYGFGGGGFVSTVDGIQGGFTIAHGVVIENATGGSGNDMLIGNDADNDLTGNNGNDVIYGDAGDDNISGGANNDTAYGGTGDDDVDAGSGNDMVAGNSGADDIQGASGTNTIYGGSGFDNITGGTGSDTIFGGSGDDTIMGNGGSDTIFGGRGDDTIDGGAGSDQITGGMGADELTGGMGSDSFIYSFVGDSVVGETDNITDFAVGVDNIDLSAIDADLAAEGDQAFAVVDSFTGTAGEIVLGAGTVSIDRNGDGNADMEILVDGVTLTVDDFIL